MANDEETPALIPEPKEDSEADNDTFDFIHDEDDDDAFLDDDDDNFSDGIYEIGDNPPPYLDSELPMCIVCQQRPPYSKGGKSYPTCGMTCAGILETAVNSATSASNSGGSPRAGPSSFRIESYRGRGAASTHPASHSSKNGSADLNVRNLARHMESLNMKQEYDYSTSGGSPRSASSSYRTGSHRRGAAPSTSYYSQNPPSSADPSMKHLAQHLGGHNPRRPNLSNQHNFPPSRNASNDDDSPPPRSRSYGNTIVVNVTPRERPSAPIVKCVVCVVKPCRDSKYVTCGLTCAEKLCKDGGNPQNCDYCHRRPKAPGYKQCGKTCAESAKFACLLCKCRPKFKRYHLCGRSCKQIASKSTPLILEAPPGHATYDLVENKFKSGWKYPGTPIPPIKKIYKIIEGKNFLQPYDKYKKTVGNEVFRYHGTTRKCTLGNAGNTKLCSNTSCALCSILRTSFKTSLASPSGAFGAGVYSSSASNKAYSYTSGGSGAMLLTKVVLGKIRQVTGWNEVMACPPGFNSVVYDRLNGSLNETIVYSDDAIRPVFLIIF